MVAGPVDCHLARDPDRPARTGGATGTAANARFLPPRIIDPEGTAGIKTKCVDKELVVNFHKLPLSWILLDTMR